MIKEQTKTIIKQYAPHRIDTYKELKSFYLI